MKKDTPFWDASLPIEERLDWLLAEMTMDEKLSCLASSALDLERLGIPGFYVGGEAAHGVEARNDQNGLGNPEPTTSFVQPIGMSATWDVEMIRKAGEVVGTEARVLYHRHPNGGLSRWAPTVDLERDPRWGRNEEGYGEDPLLTGEMASAYIRGMQGDDDHYLRIASTLKHFYGNNLEEGRIWRNSSIDPRNRYELYLEPFRRAIQDGGAEAAMTAYNRINGVPGILNHEVQDLLKDQYGLKHAVSDGGAMSLVASAHHYYGLDAETLAGALRAGVDAMSESPESVTAAAREAWELGILSEEDVNRAVRNMFRTKLRLGIYDEPVRNPYDNVTEEDLLSKEHEQICLQMSREAVVLLKNENQILPLNPSMPAEDLAVIGPLADAWYQDWYGGEPPFKTTLKDGIEEILGKGSVFVDGWDRVVFRYGDKAIAVADDGELTLADTSDIFIKEAWDQDFFAFRCERTGKLWNLRLPSSSDGKEEMGQLVADRDQAFDWFVTEIFHLSEVKDDEPDEESGEARIEKSDEEENGDAMVVTIADRFEDALVLSEDGGIRSKRGATPAKFVMETISSGIKEAKRVAASAKCVILACGCHPMIDCKETLDRNSIAFPTWQEKLLDAVMSANGHTVMALFTNFPYAMNEAQKMVPGILLSATGAQDMGKAMAETLFGKNAPAGRLNQTWYKSDSQLPNINDYDIIKGGRTYRYFQGDVLYPFGYGLTYAKFTYEDLQVSLKVAGNADSGASFADGTGNRDLQTSSASNVGLGTKVTDDADLRISVRITNVGKCTSDEVVQIYGIAPPSRAKKPLRQLLAFRRVKSVSPGESRLVEFSVPIREFRFYDVISGTLMVEGGRYRIFAGGSSMDREVEAEIEIPGSHPGKRDLRKRIRADHYDDYKNLALTEGHFSYSAVTLADSWFEGVLRFDDCDLGENPQAFSLHLWSECGCNVMVFVDGEDVAYWQGDTRTYRANSGMPPMDSRGRIDAFLQEKSWTTTYTDIVLPITVPITPKDTHTVEIRITKDAKLCYFSVK